VTLYTLEGRAYCNNGRSSDSVHVGLSVNKCLTRNTGSIFRAGQELFRDAALVIQQNRMSNRGNRKASRPGNTDIRRAHRTLIERTRACFPHLMVGPVAVPLRASRCVRSGRREGCR
jgi:hypothetical protein